MRLLCIGFVMSLALSACGGHSHDEGAYDAYQDCFDEHTVDEGLEFQEAVVVCCLDHDIDGKKPACGASSADCVTYLSTNLSSSASSADVQAACDEFETQLGM